MSSFAFVIHNKKLLLMLRDNKPTIPNPNTWSLLGGRDEEGETPEQTLFRELKEEANIEKSPITFLWEEASDNQGAPDGRRRYYYHLPLQDQQLESIQLGDEGQELKFFSFAELKTIPLTWRMTKMLNEEEEMLKQLLASK
jgi:8-oxo-dGTP diphosphatase